MEGDFKMTESVYVIQKPPVGVVQRHVDGFIEWAPGNGIAYRLVVQSVPESMRAALGGSVTISVQSRQGNFYTSYVGNPGGVYSLAFIEEKFGERDDSLRYITALINWAIFGEDSMGGECAQEIFDKAQEDWPSQNWTSQDGR